MGETVDIGRLDLASEAPEIAEAEIVGQDKNNVGGRRPCPLCRSWERSRSEVIEEALVQYLDWNDQQIAHIRAGIAEADRGDVVPHAEVVAMFKKWRDRCG